MKNDNTTSFCDNPAVINRSDRYDTVTVDTAKILKSYRKSLFAFEWMTQDGTIKTLEELSDLERVKRQDVENLIAQGQPIPMSILGIGMMNNVEIGIGRAAFLTLAAHGAESIPVHIPKSNAKEFRTFLR